MSAAALLLFAALGVDVARCEPVTPATARLSVVVEGLDPAGGELRLALFDDEGRFRERRGAVRRQVMPVRGERLVWCIEGLRPGPHAVLVFQDIDRDGELDRNGLGIPVEPYGFSNGARGRFGPPGYDEARFEITGPARTITVRLR